ncbi:DUF6625 family protein [Poritiphilus flavus]|uniref:Uncharacterized protein n=1 Tax=Poritiphilus flavus TaxID=2697053 RepID=A0A6L9EE70_9FLAO|nr:DUF6625 family protein [Poritiphilus flavus]NAS13007.1 hypothetical protein [Poritiphilus flavus]
MKVHAGKNRMKKIKLINCYFGSFPWYFKLFLKSCCSNPTIEFLIFSDHNYEGVLPKNVEIIYYTLNDFIRDAEEVLDCKINIKSAYKLCDFKPAYGVIFSDYLKAFDFWGICDIDVILGRIRNFFPDELLDKYDVFSVNRDYPSGFFMLFKNETKSNMLFSKSKDYLEVFKSDKHYCFDECNFKHDLLRMGKDIFSVNCDIESMHHVLKNEQSTNAIKTSFRMLAIESLPGNLEWNNGILIYSSEYEALLYHLIDFKSNIYTKKYLKSNISDRFFIHKHLITNKHKSHFQIAIIYFYYEKFYPFLRGLIRNMDFYISYLIPGFSSAPRVEGKYKFWNTVVSIKKNETKEYILSLTNSNQSYPVHFSVFNSKTLFIRSKPNIELKICETTEGFITKIVWTNKKGLQRVYEIIKD